MINHAVAADKMIRRWHEAGSIDGTPPPDVRIVTSDGQSIPAHSGILATASPVLDRLLQRSPPKGPAAERIIRILGVPFPAVLTFVELLYSSKSLTTAAEIDVSMQKYGVQLLVLSHAYRVRWLKRKCESAIGRQLSAGNVIDVIKFARSCDMPRLHLHCMKLVEKDFAAVQQSEGWRFIQIHDQALEQEILRFLQVTEQRRKIWKRERADQEMYQQLSDAMNCFQDLWTTEIQKARPIESIDETSTSCSRCSCSGSGKRGGNGELNGGASYHFSCQRLGQLTRHFDTCNKKLKPKGCAHCKRMVQLFRLHSSICDQAECCKVPFCRRFKSKMQKEEKVDDRTWTLLVRKVLTARVKSSLGKRKRPEHLQVLQKSISKYRGRR